jgi:hypothetical protein
MTLYGNGGTGTTERGARISEESIVLLIVALPGRIRPWNDAQDQRKDEGHDEVSAG